MSTRTCRIYGADGFDLDVLHNLVRFYRELGHRVVVGHDPRPADVLVVQRAPDREVDFRPFGAVHIWDYVGTPSGRLLAGPTVDERVTVFTSSQARADRLRDGTAATVIPLVPPVSVDLWREPLQPVAHTLVHIGNFKPYYRDGGDDYAVRFLQALTERHAEVWGTGWPDGAGVPRGPLPQFRASAVYAASTTALGMMYPFQRDVSFSGRFWHAPLNGCRLVGEPSVYAGVWPGVESTDYTADDLDRLLATSPDRATLQEQASDFWSTHWGRAKEQVAAAAFRSSGAGVRLKVLDRIRSDARLAAQRVPALTHGILRRHHRETNR